MINIGYKEVTFGGKMRTQSKANGKFVKQTVTRICARESFGYEAASPRGFAAPLPKLCARKGSHRLRRLTVMVMGASC